jgi:CHAT domain-containing protein
MPKRIHRNVGLAEAFMRSGVANCMGTYRPVGDAPAKRFSEVFYGGLLRGKASGQSLLEARKELQGNRWVDWADYVLYSSPEFVLKCRQLSSCIPKFGR